MSTFAIGDEVSIPYGHRAILRWIGRIPSRGSYEYAGVEVVGPDATRVGRHSGEYDGVKYFSTSAKGTGLFVAYAQLISTNVSARLPSSLPFNLDPQSSQPPSPHRMMSPISQMMLQPNFVADQSGAGDVSMQSFFVGSPRGSSPAFNLQVANLQTTNVQNSGYVVTSPVYQKRSSSSDSAELELLKAQLGVAKREFSEKREQYREMVEAANNNLKTLETESNKKLADIKQDYEAKLRKARRSSVLQVTGGLEMEEQRIALAAMQNQMTNERAQKQEEIDDLKRDLASMQKVAGNTEELEALVDDLSKYEQELAELRSKVNDFDKLQEEVKKLRSANAELTAKHSPRSSNGSSPHNSPNNKIPEANTNSVSREEFEQLERALEAKLLKESELHHENEHLELRNRKIQEELVNLNKQLEQLQLEQHTKQTLPEERSPTPIRQVSVPIPESLNAYDADKSAIDITPGRTDWCSLCEREGHVALNCPFE